MLDRHHHQSVAASTFSLFLPPLPTKVHHHCWPEEECDDDGGHSSVTTSPSSPSSSSSTAAVDCTLSLGTPSSRRAAADSVPTTKPPRSAVYPSLVSWDNNAVAAAAAVDRHHHQQQQSSYYCCHHHRQQQGGKGCAVAHDAFVDRRCANCGTTSTPLWRNGPRGPKSLCNACGIRFKKEERRAAAMESGGAGCGYYSAQCEHGAAVASRASFPCGGGGGDPADANAAPLLAWRLNVWPERASLFQYN